LPKFIDMGLNTFAKIFMPRDKIFYNLFEEIAHVVQKMGEKLVAVVGEPDFDIREVGIRQLEDMEHDNDELTHRVFTELGRNFITPFDREDIHYLATALDDVADNIYSSAKKINFYRVDPGDPGIQKLASLINEGCTELRNAVLELRNMRNLRKITGALVRINALENQADDVYDTSIQRLFATENDAKEVIKKKDIFQVLEIATDKCEDVANVIESIIVKYA
jgi:uncharacterized protein Yka (UPF0111/DUF47 family)